MAQNVTPSKSKRTAPDAAWLAHMAESMVEGEIVALQAALRRFRRMTIAERAAFFPRLADSANVVDVLGLGEVAT